MNEERDTSGPPTGHEYARTGDVITVDGRVVATVIAAWTRNRCDIGGWHSHHGTQFVGPHPRVADTSLKGETPASR